MTVFVASKRSAVIARGVQMEKRRKTSCAPREKHTHTLLLFRLNWSARQPSVCAVLCFIFVSSPDDDDSFLFANGTRTRLYTPTVHLTTVIGALHAFTAFVTNRISFEHVLPRRTWAPIALHCRVAGFRQFYLRNISRSSRPRLSRPTVTARYTLV